ncbi:hypothetical protein [Streptomyces sp. NPDC005732]|uniref:hypothetical protein n=1 Tax=Streptomyces sp. NPDC005732 TaxID=3157057 RepID=UPI0033C618B0
MVDDDAAAEENGTDPEAYPNSPQEDFDIRPMGALPGGKSLVFFESDGGLGLAVDEHQVPPKVQADLRQGLGHIIRSGLWRQNWQQP